MLDLWSIKKNQTMWIILIMTLLGTNLNQCEFPVKLLERKVRSKPHTTCKQSASAAADNNPKAKRSKLWPIQWPITLSCFEHFLFIRVSYKLHPRAPRPMLQNGVWQGQLFIVEDSLFERENASAICYLQQTVAKSLKTSSLVSLWTKGGF